METFKFKFRRSRWWFKKTYKVVGYNPMPEVDRMALYFPNGSLYEIPDWSKCECWLGVDWVIWQKNRAEAQAGVDLKLANGVGEK